MSKVWVYKVNYETLNTENIIRSSKILRCRDFNKFVRNAFVRITGVKCKLVTQSDANIICEKYR